MKYHYVWLIWSNWNPPSLFELGQRTGFDIESLIFAFAIGGIGVVLYNSMRRQQFPQSRNRSREAKSFGNPVVIAVNANQALGRSEIRAGFQALTRAVDICQLCHAHVRFGEADLALQPAFRRPIDTLDFEARRECVAAGIGAVRRNRAELRRLLGLSSSAIDKDALSGQRRR